MVFLRYMPISWTAVRFFAEQHEMEIQESASVLTVANLVRLVRQLDSDIVLCIYGFFYTYMGLFTSSTTVR